MQSTGCASQVTANLLSENSR